MSVPLFHEVIYSLALSLLGDVTDGGALLADNGAHILCGDQQPDRDVRVLMFVGDPRAGRHLAGVSSRTVSGTSAVVWASLRVDIRVFIRDV